MSEDIQVDEVAERSRYEIRSGGAVAGFAIYRREGGRTTFTHTIVKPEYEGQGLGSRLARFALDDTVARGERIVPECPFIRAYLERHPEYADSVDPVPGADEH
ncbi:GNAT family N-acetyltransferase [Agromyces mediolanus]|uniref:GNAT family N-acetyltransferase n=1 Tax=Agromyces mediolanus TaxID=41986 RepID=UPI003837E54A